MLRPFVQLGWGCHTFRPAANCWAILSMLLAKWENCQRRRDRAGASTAKVNADVYPSHVHTAGLKSEIPLTVPTIRFIYLKLSGINLLESLRLDLYRTGQMEKKEENRVFLWKLSSTWFMNNMYSALATGPTKAIKTLFPYCSAQHNIFVVRNSLFSFKMFLRWPQTEDGELCWCTTWNF